jgi:carboxypeptidase T
MRKPFALLLILFTFPFLGVSSPERYFYFVSKTSHGEILYQTKDGLFYCIDTSLPADATLIKTFPKVFELGKFHSYEQVGEKLSLLAQKYSEKCEFLSIGKSYENRDVWAIRFKPKKPSPAFLFIGCHHAREWMSVEVPMELARVLAENPNSDPKINEYLEKFDIWIIPMLNPDGHIYSINSNRMWRKNRSVTHNGVAGVDLNRNYSYQWGNMGSSDDPTEDNYHGTEPFSENETQIIRDLASEIPLFGCLTYHTYGELIIYPWGHSKSTAPFSENLDKLAVGMAKLGGPPNDNEGQEYPHYDEYDYIPMQASRLYEAAGDTTDYLYSQYGAPSFTIELGDGKNAFIPPDSEIEPTLKQVMPFNFFFMDEVPKEFCLFYGKVTDSFGNVKTPKIRIGNLEFQLSPDPSNGRFSRVLPKGRHILKVDGKTIPIDLKDATYYLPIVLSDDKGVKLSGKVVDTQGNQIKAKVMLLNTQETPVGKGMSDGTYTFEVPKGSYTLQLSMDGVLHRQKVILKSNLTFDFFLPENPGS